MWIFGWGLNKDEDVVEITKLLETAGRHGLNGAVVSFGLDTLCKKPDDYFRRLDAIKQACDRNKLALTRQTVLADVLGWIASARNAAPMWSGTGISSTGPLSDPNTGLACILNDNGAGAPLYSEFNGAVVDENSILVKYTYNGDADANGMIDGRDYLRADYGYLAGMEGYAFGDCDYDGDRDGDDYFLMDSAFLSQTVVLAALTSTPAAAIPAPAVVAWAARPAEPPSPAVPVIGFASAWSRSARAIGESPLVPAALRDTVRSMLASDDVILGRWRDTWVA